MYNTVLIPGDGNDHSVLATEQGNHLTLGIAEQYSAEIHVIYVDDTMSCAFEDTPQSIVGHLKQRGQKAVKEISPDARDRNLPVTTDILRGVPHEEIREYATGDDADWIAVGDSWSNRGHRSALREHYCPRRQAIRRASANDRLISMSLETLCQSCESAPADYQCRRCGAIVCSGHYDAGYWAMY
jgi:nucleotide-binding universal stress UspA family protein